MFSLCIFVLSLAGGLRQPVRLSVRWPKTTDCAAHSMGPPVLLLILQENQETWPRARGDIAAAAHPFYRRPAVIWLQKTAKTAMARGAGFIAVAWCIRAALVGRGCDALQCRVARNPRPGHRPRRGLPRPQ